MDPNDRHLLAAATAGGTTTHVTFNLKDFPRRECTYLGIMPLHPDSFLLSLLATAPEAVLRAIHDLTTTMLHPPTTPVELLSHLRQCHVPEFITAVRALL